jgi:acyl-CoA synthetase (AMP-forming)/AMP-acid ligase II
MSHVGAFVLGALAPCLLGTTAALLPRWDAREAVEVIRDERVVFAAGATVLLADLVSAYEAGAASGLRSWQTGAAAVPADLIRRADAVGVIAWRAWGMTECPNAAVGGIHASARQRATTDGRIEPTVEAKAVDPSGRAVLAGREGELCLRGAKLMRGYTRPEATLAQVDADGWFHTGDLGTIVDGWVTVTGRLKDLINRGGEKFSARDIENAIVVHGSVDEVAVIGAPDPRLGEVVVAFMRLRADAQFPGDEAMEHHLVEMGLARPKFPVAWHILDALPYTATGKVDKRMLLRALTFTPPSVL